LLQLLQVDDHDRLKVPCIRSTDGPDPRQITSWGLCIYLRLMRTAVWTVTDLELRGLRYPHPDGGIRELIEQAQQGDRSFDAVICESIERIARRTYYGTKIEHDLELHIEEAE
jgi:hypothetical protein